MEKDTWRARKEYYDLGNGARLACILTGPEDAPPLLLVHGFTDSSRTWSGIAAGFPGFRLVIPDLRGHGDSRAPASGYSLEDYARDIEHLADALGIRECSMVGHSLGGIIAQQIAIGCRLRIGKLVLIGTTARPDRQSSDELAAELANELQNAGRSMGEDSPFLQRWYANPGGVDKCLIEPLRREAAAISKHVLQETAAGLGSIDLEPEIGRITADTLLVWGDADPFFGLPMQSRIASAVPRCRLVTMKGLGHNPFWEKPQEVTSLIRDFIASAG